MTMLLGSLMMSAPLYAQKKTVKKTTTQLKTYVARDEAFKPDYKLTPIGTFNADNVANMQFTKVPKPIFEGQVLKRNMSRKQVALQQLYCKPNSITDDDDWYVNNDLFRRETRIETPMNSFAPRYTYKTGGYLVTAYGPNWGNTRHLVITDEQQSQYYAAYDFADYIYSPKTTLMGNTQSIDDVLIEGNILYFSHGSNGYSDGAGYQTGYITAFDMETGMIIWTTQPMTCNSHFTIVGNSIICGYGFTSEPDYLYVLDKYSGQRVSRTPMKKMVSDVVVKNGYAYVRTYSYDYLFKIK